MEEKFYDQSKLDDINQKFVQHLKNRLKIRQTYKDLNIQMQAKQQNLFSQIKETQIPDNFAQNVCTMMKDLKQYGFDDFRFLGGGQQGIVLLAKQQLTNRRYAIKGIQIKDDSGKTYEEKIQQADNEINMLKKCKGSPYVVNFITKLDGQQFIYLILNECMGNLKEIIESNPNKQLNELTAIKYAKDIAEGLLYIHSKKCLANDMKMDNILIDYNGNAVICDLGLADNLTKTNGHGQNLYQGNFQFQAPECFVNSNFVYLGEYKKRNIQILQNPTPRSEACSLGYLIYHMFQEIDFLNFMYKKHESLNLDKIKNFTYYKQLKYIIDGLTKFIPEERLEIKDALIILKGIISYEFKLDQKFVEVMVDDNEGITQKYLKQIKQEIEFVQVSENEFYPIIQDEEKFVQEFDKEFHELKNQNLNLGHQISNLNLLLQYQTQQNWEMIQFIQKIEAKTNEDLFKLKMQIESLSQQLLEQRQKNSYLEKELLSEKEIYKQQRKKLDEELEKIQKYSKDNIIKKFTIDFSEHINQNIQFYQKLDTYLKDESKNMQTCSNCQINEINVFISNLSLCSICLRKKYFSYV